MTQTRQENVMWEARGEAGTTLDMGRSFKGVLAAFNEATIKGTHATMYKIVDGVRHVAFNNDEQLRRNLRKTHYHEGNK